MSDSILQSTKKVLNIPADHDVFDPDVIMHINSVFSTLNQLGVGPSDGFMIQDGDANWSDFLEGVTRLNHIKTYMYLRVRLLFDPPNTGYLVDAMSNQIKELEWRINTQREDEAWTAPPTTSSSFED